MSVLAVQLTSAFSAQMLPAMFVFAVSLSLEEEPTHEEERGGDGACESATLTRATVFAQGFIREPE
jgi:hypothetical protein